MKKLIVAFLVIASAAAAERLWLLNCGCEAYRYETTGKHIGIKVCAAHEKKLSKEPGNKAALVALSRTRPGSVVWSRTHWAQAWLEYTGTVWTESGE